MREILFYFSEKIVKIKLLKYHYIKFREVKDLIGFIILFFGVGY